MPTFKRYLVLPIKPKDNFSLLLLFCFAFAKQSQATETVRFFFEASIVIRYFMVLY